MKVRTPETGRAFARLAFSEAVKTVQARYGVRDHAERIETAGSVNAELTPAVLEIIAACDSFFIASAGRSLWPHVQHRGGPPGFLKPLDAMTLAFGDFDGNRQFITLGNITENPRVVLLIIERGSGRRLKLWAEAEVVEDDPDLLATLGSPAYPTRPRRAVLLHLRAFDINCHQHIPRRYAA